MKPWLGGKSSLEKLCVILTYSILRNRWLTRRYNIAERRNISTIILPNCLVYGVNACRAVHKIRTMENGSQRIASLNQTPNLYINLAQTSHGRLASDNAAASLATLKAGMATGGGDGDGGGVTQPSCSVCSWPPGRRVWTRVQFSLCPSMHMQPRLPAHRRWYTEPQTGHLTASPRIGSWQYRQRGAAGCSAMEEAGGGHVPAVVLGLGRDLEGGYLNVWFEEYIQSVPLRPSAEEVAHSHVESHGGSYVHPLAERRRRCVRSPRRKDVAAEGALHLHSHHLLPL